MQTRSLAHRHGIAVGQRKLPRTRSHGPCSRNPARECNPVPITNRAPHTMHRCWHITPCIMHLAPFGVWRSSWVLCATHCMPFIMSYHHASSQIPLVHCTWVDALYNAVLRWIDHSCSCMHTGCILFMTPLLIFPFLVNPRFLVNEWGPSCFPNSPVS